MKMIKAFLLMSLLTISFPLAFSGCYTQLAIVDNEQNSAVESSPSIIYQPEIATVYIPVPVYETQSSPAFYTLPAAGSSSTVTESHSQSQTRDSGYQRSSQAGNAQTANSVSNTRTSGSTRGGR